MVVPVANLLAKKVNFMTKEKAGLPSKSDQSFSLADSDTLAELLANLDKMVKLYTW